MSETTLSSPLSTLADNLLKAGCIKFGEFTLKSGLKSPIYIDLRRIISDPNLLQQVGAAYLPLLEKLTFDRIAGLPYAAIPISTAISLAGNYPMIYPRKEVKEYGTKAQIEGDYHPGETIVVIDDLATTGGSKFEAIEKLTGAGLVVKDVVVLVDRESGAKESLAEAGYAMHAVLTISEMLDHWEEMGKVEKEKIDETRKFLEQSKDKDMSGIAVNVAVIQDNKILLTQRDDFETWILPGGGIENGESVAQAAIRETKEETGLYVELTQISGNILSIGKLLG